MRVPVTVDGSATFQQLTLPLVAQLAELLAAHKLATPFSAQTDWVFATSHGTPYGHRNVARRCLTRAAERAALNDDGWPPLRFTIFATPSLATSSSTWGSTWRR
jgi:hypothetical protein